MRERLKKILEYIDGVCPSVVSCYNCEYKDDGEGCSMLAKADYLIANGVTVQEWISVKDRLPEQTDPATAVLGITKQGKCYVVYYYKAAINDEFTGFYDNAVKRAVTHWMPLPQPPKGE